MVGKKHACIYLLACLILVLGLSVNSHAQGWRDAVYDDVRSLIVDLMEKEATLSIVPSIACRLDPVVKYYFRGTLQRIYERQYGSLGEVVLQDIEGIVQNLVFLIFDNPSADSDLDFLIERLRPGDNEIGLESPEQCIAKINLLGGPMNASQQVKLPVQQQCAQAELTDSKTRFACEIARAISLAAIGKTKSVRPFLLRALVAMLFDIADEKQVAEQTSLLEAALAGKALPANTAGLINDVARLLQPFFYSNEFDLDLLANALEIIRTVCALKQSPLCARLTKSTTYVELLIWLLRSAHNGNLTEIVSWLVKQAVPPTTGELYSLNLDALDANSERIRKYRYVRGQKSSLVNQDGEPAVAPERLLQIYRRFLVSVIAYALETREGHVPSGSVRESLRDAALEALGTISSKRGGFERSWSYNIIIPQLALRAAMSQGYNNQQNGGYRFAASVDAIVLRMRLMYIKRWYVALNFCVLDLLGPFAEFSLRGNQISYQDEYKVWWNFLAPSVEVLVGSPLLSRRLALSIRLGLRGTSAYDSEDNPNKKIYRSLFDKDTYPIVFSRHLEMGIGLKYIF